MERASMTEIPEFTTRPELAGTFGMVASTHWLATAAGMAVLERGGNAFDAAAAAGFTLQVVEPHLNGPGGEVPVIGHDARRGETFVVCGQGTAPAGATPEAYAGLGLDLVPGSGLLAATVPGAFGGWLLLLREYGTLRLRDVLGYAIGYAADGYPLVPAISWSIASVADLFREHWHTSAEAYLPGGGVPAPGRRFANRALAATYERVLAEAEAAGADRDAQLEAARRAWYDGFVAEEIGKFATTEVMDVTGERHRGLLTAHDLSTWHARLEAPASRDYRGLTVSKTGPWGQGPVFLQQLALLEGIDLTAMGPGSPDFIHTVTEAAKLAFADREAWYGDPAFTDVPLDDLLSAPYNDERRGLIGDTASMELRERARGHPRHAPDARRHLPPRRRGPLGQRGDRDAERRLAAVLAGHPVPRLLPRHPGADVHAGSRAARDDRSRQAAADHADPDPGAARRRAVPGVRHARRRPAGPVDARLLPQPRALRDEPAAGDRLPGVPLRAHAVLVLPARGLPGPPRRGVPGRRRGHRRACPPRPRRPRPAAVVARPDQRRRPPGWHGLRRRQPARHARLRRRPLTPAKPGR
jgi:gamma-glutamyltranspeptidase